VPIFECLCKPHVLTEVTFISLQLTQKVVTHPLFGKALVARYDLPAKYRMAYWGIRGKCASCDVEDRAISFYPPNPVTGSNIDPKVEGGRTLKRNNYNGVLNPGRTGDVIQFAGCPGPDEKQNMRSTFQYYGLRNGIIGGLEFVTLQPVPKNTQLLHWYGSGKSALVVGDLATLFGLHFAFI